MGPSTGSAASSPASGLPDPSCGHAVRVRYQALATDYDGTIASDGHVPEPVIEALERARTSGRRLLLVTGRELDELLTVFDRIELFDRVVAENGALLYRPDTKERIRLCEPPPAAFAEELQRRGVEPLSIGDVIVATREPHQIEVLETIREQGLELQVIFNKGAVMVLPPGVNKATGMRAALGELGLSERNVIGVGDAENDHAFLDRCELSVAVANALPSLKDRCDHVTDAHHGAGVAELIDAVLENEDAWQPSRHRIEIGTADDEPVVIEPFGETILVAGPSGSGKSTTVTSILEQLIGRGYQLCVIDPEGDYGSFSSTVELGDPEHAPLLDEVVQLLEQGTSVDVNLIGVKLADRPAFFESMLGRLAEVLTRTGRPHWMIIDEAHHLMPDGWMKTVPTLREVAGSTMFVTVHPDLLAPPILELITTAIAVGADPTVTLEPIATAARQPSPEIEHREDRVVLWRPGTDQPAVHLEPAPSTEEHHRHVRKYAAGDLEERAFIFRGPDGDLALRAQNLQIFSQMAEGIDERTWQWHLERGDYARWFEVCVKDPELASIAEQAATRPETSRETILAAIEERYTAPASPPPGRPVRANEAART